MPETPAGVQACRRRFDDRRLPEFAAAVLYDDDTHTYWLDGQRVTSVTQALVVSGDIDTRYFTPVAAERGRRVHAVCEAIDRGHLVIDEQLPDSDRAYVDAYRRFLSDARPEYDVIEAAFWHVRLRYGGRPDRGLRQLFGSRGTLEIKTGAASPWHGIQLAGYERLRPAGPRWVVYLKPTGRYQLHQCTRAADHADWLRALSYTQQEGAR